MGEKKKKEAAMKTVNKVLIVGACVLFVVLMIISGMGSGWLTMFSVVKPGDTVVIDYTVFDAAGKPVITSEQTTYNQAVAQGQDIFGSKQLTIISNQTMEKPIYAVQGYASTGSSVQQLAIFSSEYNAISSGIIGMKVNEQKRIPIFSAVSMTNELSVEQLALSKINLTGRNGQAIPAPTVSQGIAIYPDEADEIFALIDLADQRLYVAKSRGRDQVEPNLVNI